MTILILIVNNSVAFVVSVTSPSKVYIETSAKSPHYSQNDEHARRIARRKHKAEDGSVRFIEVLEQKCWLSIRTVLRDAEIEIQDIVAFIGKYFDL